METIEELESALEDKRTIVYSRENNKPVKVNGYEERSGTVIVNISYMDRRGKPQTKDVSIDELVAII